MGEDISFHATSKPRLRAGDHGFVCVTAKIRGENRNSGAWFEIGLEGDFAGLENFESAAPVGVAREFQ